MLLRTRNIKPLANRAYYHHQDDLKLRTEYWLSHRTTETFMQQQTRRGLFCFAGSWREKLQLIFAAAS